jgi:hypothetical protein
MFIAFAVITGREPKRVLDDIMLDLQLGDGHGKGDWFLGEDFIVLRMYGAELAPHRLPMRLTPRTIVLDYVRQLVEIYEIHYLKSKKKSCMTYPIIMGGYAVLDKKGAKEAT